MHMVKRLWFSMFVVALALALVVVPLAHPSPAKAQSTRAQLSCYDQYHAFPWYTLPNGYGTMAITMTVHFAEDGYVGNPYCRAESIINVGQVDIKVAGSVRGDLFGQNRGGRFIGSWIYHGGPYRGGYYGATAIAGGSIGLDNCYSGDEVFQALNGQQYFDWSDTWCYAPE